VRAPAEQGPEPAAVCQHGQVHDHNPNRELAALAFYLQLPGASSGLCTIRGLLPGPRGLLPGSGLRQLRCRPAEAAGELPGSPGQSPGSPWLAR